MTFYLRKYKRKIDRIEVYNSFVKSDTQSDLGDTQNDLSDTQSDLSDTQKYVTINNN